MQAKQEIIDLLKHSLNKNGWIDLPAKGVSMFPFIREGNICRFILQEPALLKKGEIVLFTSSSNQLIAHRLCSSFFVNGEQYFLFKGDSNLGFDELVKANQIIGKLSLIQSKRVQSHNFFANLYGRLILSAPILSRLFRIYLDKFKTT